MTKKEVILCDGCNKVLERPQDQYSVNVTSGHFWDGAETGHILEKLDFCRSCALDIKNTLHKINKKLEEKKENKKK